MEWREAPPFRLQDRGSWPPGGRLQDQGPLSSPKCWTACGLSVFCYSTGLHRNTGSISDEIKMRYFIRILICGQKQMLDMWHYKPSVFWKIHSQKVFRDWLLRVCLRPSTLGSIHAPPTNQQSVLMLFSQAGLLGRIFTRWFLNVRKTFSRTALRRREYTPAIQSQPCLFSSFLTLTFV